MNDPTIFQAVAPKADRQIDTSKLPQPSTDYLNEFTRIVQEQFGIKVTNLSGHRIGFGSARPGPWLPVTGFRETLRGRLKKYEVGTGHAFDLYQGSNDTVYMQGEYDWNLYIVPADSHKERFKDEDLIVGEVTPAENYYDNRWFPLKGTKRPSLLLTRDLCIYGPFIYDQGNTNDDNDGYEIHPIDAIWWSEGSDQVMVILLQDAAKGRFRDVGMFTTDPRDAHFPEWKPWIEYPQLEEIRIPFSYDPQNGNYQHIMVDVITAMDISTGQQTGWIDSDEGAEHQLLQKGPLGQPDVVQLPVLVRVTEEKGFENRQIAVQFTGLTRDAGGIIRGYVQLVAALGDKLNRHEGLLELALTFKKGDNTPVLTH